MHLIKIVARIFYAQCNAQQKERFLALFLMGTFRDGLCFPRRSPFAGRRFGARKSHENRPRAEVPPQLDYSRLLYRQLQLPNSMLPKKVRRR